MDLSGFPCLFRRSKYSLDLDEGTLKKFVANFTFQAWELRETGQEIIRNKNKRNSRDEFKEESRITRTKDNIFEISTENLYDFSCASPLFVRTGTRSRFLEGIRERTLYHHSIVLVPMMLHHLFFRNQ